MDKFSSRQFQIIQILNREKRIIDSSFLCAELKVSKRTLIKDIVAINQNKNYILSG
ncbi:MAG: HTH domain-containing protein, partial [Erysipelotrichaceae bacterium]|nr:HTH domain-containing protein [Erysipelotrichaceae bacterium]